MLDFGIAKLTDQLASGGKNTAVIGSLAPEQLDLGSTISPRTDVWSLGLIAFTLLTGRSLWRTAFNNSMALTVEIATAPLPRASQRAHELGVGGCLPPSFDDWFASCVVRDPRQRLVMRARRSPPSTACFQDARR